MTVRIHPIKLGVDNCYILQDEGTVMIDGGAPNTIKKFKARIEKLKIDPREIQLIILTHGHWDHIGSARDFKALTGARLALHEKEKGWLENSLKPMPPGVSLWGHIFGGIVKAFLPLVRIPAEKVDVVLDDNDFSLAEYGIHGEVIHTPGHSAGSVSVLLETGDAFVGDMAMNTFPMRFTPGLPIFAENMNILKSSWEKLLDRGAQTVHPAHGSPFPIKIIREALHVSTGS
ncbi:MAG: MBL fold metallo-hydrolase [Desulfobacteraceae bacterium]|nr:MAG: MBL fold metallo-hydrolase [Desulfobacteraceae bacterium]